MTPPPKIPSWSDVFMTMAYLVAMRSKDQSTHIGAVVVGPDNEVRSTGYNSFVRNLDDNRPERQKRPEKYFWFEHAERNAIYNATLIGESLKNCTLYTNGVPCMDCARGVVQSGIKKVVVDKSWCDADPEIWVEQAKRAIQMFKEVEIEVEYWEGELVNIVKFHRDKIM